MFRIFFVLQLISFNNNLVNNEFPPPPFSDRCMSCVILLLENLIRLLEFDKHGKKTASVLNVIKETRHQFQPIK